jgi:cytochrome c
MDMLAAIPSPRDIPLPLPFDRVILEAVVVLLFLAHILFVLLMVGGSLLTVACEALGVRRKDYDTLARRITDTITVNKSLAVVLGVAPLLGVNVIYTGFFYNANSLTGMAWIMLVPLVTAAFLLGYAHKYTWDRLSGAKWLHISIGAFAAVLFLIIPLIFLANINLMLFPERWTEARGWFSTLAFPNVLPRYFHFLLACIAVTALFLLAYFTRAGFPVESIFETWDRAALRRGFYSLAFGATLGQFVAGPLLFFTLPAIGMSWWLIAVIAAGVIVAIVVMILMWREILSDHAKIGRRFAAVVVMLTFTVLCMGYGRHIYRENATDPYRRQMARQTEDFRLVSAAARERSKAGISAQRVPLGELVFQQVCSSCHALDRVVTGPPLREIVQLYAGNPDGIVKWANAPGRKRTNMPAMAAQRIGDTKLKAVSEYMLKLGSGETESGKSTTPPAATATQPVSGMPTSAPAATPMPPRS